MYIIHFSLYNIFELCLFQLLVVWVMRCLIAWILNKGGYQLTNGGTEGKKKRGWSAKNICLSSTHISVISTIEFFCLFWNSHWIRASVVWLLVVRVHWKVVFLKMTHFLLKIVNVWQIVILQKFRPIVCITFVHTYYIFCQVQIRSLKNQTNKW